MKIPFTKYELAQVRKAIAAGVATDVPLLITDITEQHFTITDALALLGAFLGAALVVFQVKNKDVTAGTKVITSITHAVAPKAEPIVTQLAQNVTNATPPPTQSMPTEGP